MEMEVQLATYSRLSHLCFSRQSGHHELHQRLSTLLPISLMKTNSTALFSQTVAKLVRKQTQTEMLSVAVTRQAQTQTN